jgi:hypothetical protein
MCWIYFMKYKSKVADIFWKFKAWVEKQGTYKVQVIRSDNGIEYILEKFNNSVKKKTLSTSWQHHIPLNKMRWLRGKTEHFWRWHGVYYMTKGCQRIYGLRL